MWIVLAILLAVGWVLLKLVWGVASVAVHVLLGAAVLALVAHFLFSRRSAGSASAGT
jgi:hypothetical protein